MTSAQLIATYIHAKDANRPELTPSVFARDALLDMVVNTRSISFPPRVTGVDGITDVLIRQFGDTYEDVHTFCLCAPPSTDASAFSCAWLVGMAETASGTLRVGCGRYDWFFRGVGPARLVDRLRITIDCMQEVSQGGPVMDWLRGLPYPWCPMEMAVVTMPRIAGLEPVTRGLKGYSKASA